MRLKVRYFYQLKYSGMDHWSGPFDTTLNPQTEEDIHRVFWDYMHACLTSRDIAVAGAELLRFEILN